MQRQELLREAVNQFGRTQRAHHRLFRRLAGGFGMHRSQHRMLMDLSRAGRPVSQKEIADRQGVTPAAVTHILKKLEAEGYVERTPDEKDNRFNLIRLTDKGVAVAETTCRWFAGADRALFSGFSQEELTAFIAAIQKIRRNLEAVEAGEIPLAPLDSDEWQTIRKEHNRA